MSLLLDGMDLPRKHKNPLRASLDAAIRALEQGRLQNAVNQLESFDNKVQAQLARDFPELAERLSAAARALVGALEDCAEDAGG